MYENKRDKMPAVPENLENILNPSQLLTLRNAESNGWELYFVRREGLDVPIPVIKGIGSQAIGVIEADGQFNTEADIRLRNGHEVS